MPIFSSIRFLDDNKEIVISENGKLPELDGSLLKNLPSGTISVGNGLTGNGTSSNPIKLYLNDVTVDYPITIDLQSNKFTIVNGNDIEVSASSLINLLAGNTTIQLVDNGISSLLIEADEILFNQHLQNTAGGLAYVESTGKLPVSIIPDISSSSTISIGNGLMGDGTESNPLKLDLSNYAVNSNIIIRASGPYRLEVKKGSFGLTVSDIETVLSSIGYSIALDVDGIRYGGNYQNTAGGFAVVQENGKLPSSIIPEQFLLDATNNSKGIVQIGLGINVSDGIISVDKNSIGLNNVDNTSDLDKPISNATKNSLNNKLEANNILEGSNISLSKSGNNITINSNYDIANESLNGLMSNTDKLKLDGIQNNAEVNIINSIQVNGISQPVSDKTVNILVPDSSIFATKTELNNYLPLSGGSLSGSLTFNNSFYLNTNPTNNFNYVINTNINQNQSQLVLTINNNSQSRYTEWFFRDNTYTRYRHELNGGNGILTQFDLVSGEDENDNTSYANFNCKVISQNEFISTYHESYRIAYGTYGTFWKNDGTNLNLLITNENDQYGSYNDFRPFTVNLSTGQVSLNNYFIINTDGYTSIAGNMAISNSGITTNTGISVNGMIDCQNIVNAKTYFRKTSTTLNKNNTYAQNTYDNNLIFADSENRTIFRIDTFLGPTNNTGARLLSQNRDSSVEAELALCWRENNTPALTWSYPTYGESNELARCDWVQNQINSISGQDVITVYSGKTGILNTSDSTDTSWLQVLFKKNGNSGVIYGTAQLSREACTNLKNNCADLRVGHQVTLSVPLYGYYSADTTISTHFITTTYPVIYDVSANNYKLIDTSTRSFMVGLSLSGRLLLACSRLDTTSIATDDLLFFDFIGLCHV